MVDVKKKNLARSIDERSKNLFYKVVGRKGSKREILAPLLPRESMDKEGLVVREGRGKWSQATGSNTVPVATAKVPLNQNRNNSPRELSGERNSASQDQVNRQVNQDMEEQDRSEMDLEVQLQRSSPRGKLGSQVLTNGRRLSTSQEQWTTAVKRKSRGSNGSMGSPSNMDKKNKEENWVWDKPNNK